MAQPSLGEHFVHLGVDAGHAFIHSILVKVGHDHRHLQLAGKQQSELSSHKPGANHAHLGHGPRQLGVGSSSGTLSPLLHQI